MVLCMLIVASATLQAPRVAEPQVALSAYEASVGFKSLFDGKSLEGWTGYRRSAVPPNWAAEDGSLRVAPLGGGGDIRTVEEYGDFDLRLEWKVEPRGNSGIIYRSSEDGESSWHTGPEFQVYDDYGAGIFGPTRTSSGSLYDMYPPVKQVTRQAGQWNEARIVAQGDRIQHWLNGVKVVDCVIGSDDWNERLRRSKFREMPGFARSKSGYIVLQDHGARVWFRNLRVKRL